MVIVMFYHSSVVRIRIFLPTCPNWAMSRRVAICSVMEKVPVASRLKRGPIVRLERFIVASEGEMRHSFRGRE
eukprot:scaffold26968_cov132-Isochrysis_galbana.AAC.1